MIEGLSSTGVSSHFMVIINRRSCLRSLSTRFELLLLILLTCSAFDRGALLNESNEFIGDKVAYALGQGLKVIACVGETLEQRETLALRWLLLLHKLSYCW